MKINKIDHISINVNDLSEATAFFVELGLKVQAKWQLDGEQLDKIVGLTCVKTECVGLGMQDGDVWIELVKFHSPVDEEKRQQPLANTLGIRHICFAVDDLEAIIAKLISNGSTIFSEIQQYEESYKLCYVRGPEGIILELAEKIS